MPKKGDEGGNDIKRLNIIKNSLKNYMDNVAPGIMPRIDWHFHMLYDESFAALFLKDPVKAFDGLMDFFGGDSSTTKYFLYFVLKGLFAGNRMYVDEAYNAVLNQDIEKFKKLIKNVYGIEI